MAALPDAVMIVEPSLKINFANPAAENLYGYESGGMNGQHIWAGIGLVCVVAGLRLITAGVRAGRAARLPRAR